MNSVVESLEKSFSGFSKLSHDERLAVLAQAGLLSQEDRKFLKLGGLEDITLAEKFVENVIGYFQLPLGVATNFKVDGKDYFIPMAVEETSIIAAASKTAKWVRESGAEIKTEVIGQNIIGQIQFAKLQNPELFSELILADKKRLIDLANIDVASSMVARGGGVKDIEIRKLVRDDGYTMGIVHVLMDPCDAMGANIINQVCEYLKKPIEEMTSETATMCILSNLVDTKLTVAEVHIRQIDPELALKIEEASRFAELDPYRAATNNKGVLNGIDPILIATGNDWRAVEAGIHAFAARDGQYRSITKWRRLEDGSLKGRFEAPLIVGTVGGVTALHPTAKLSMKILGAKSATQLSRICAAVGLVQNLGALRALTTVGIIEGHMKLHIKNLSLGAGATEKEMPYVVKKLEEILALTKRISLSQAIQVLQEHRNQATAFKPKTQ